MSDIEDEIRRQVLAERGIQPAPPEQSSPQDQPIPQQNQGAYTYGGVRADTPSNQPVSQIGDTDTQKPAGTLQRRKQAGGFLGWLAGILIAIWKFLVPILAILGKLKFLLIAGKLLLTFGSMLLSIAVYSRLFGWKFGAGLVVLIFIHECGHALAARMRGIKTGIMVFIPLMGAFVTTQRYGRSLTEDAFIGIMGPVVGSVASLLCILFYFPTHDPFWLALAQWGCFVNLFNLLPTPPLDGGWITPLFSPKLLALGVIIAVLVGFRNPLIWLLLIISIPRIIAGWKADPKTQPYYQVAVADKWKYGIAYLSLALILAISSYTLGKFIS